MGIGTAPGRAALLLTLAALPALTGCRLYSYDDETHTEPTAGFPVGKAFVDTYRYAGAAPTDLMDALKKVVEGSGAVVSDNRQLGLELKLKAEMLPEKIPVIIDIVNVLTIGLFPKLRDNTLVVHGELWAEGSTTASVKVKREGKMSSIESFLPFLFFPPSWFFLTDSYGGGKGIPIYEKLAQEVIVDLAQKASTATAPKAAPCPVCGEPRGDVTPCPHCGVK